MREVSNIQQNNPLPKKMCQKIPTFSGRYKSMAPCVEISLHLPTSDLSERSGGALRITMQENSAAAVIVAIVLGSGSRIH